MMLWFKLNPSDGHRVARSIRVGLPVKSDQESQGKNEVADGHAVPEADREVVPLPLAFTKQNSVFADAVDFSYPIDLGESSLK